MFYQKLDTTNNMNVFLFISKNELEIDVFNVTEDPRYNDSACYQRFCCKIEFAVLKKLDRAQPMF